MTKQGALKDYKYKCERCIKYKEVDCDYCTTKIAIECIEKQMQIEKTVNDVIAEILRHTERIEQFEEYDGTNNGKLTLITRYVISPSLTIGIIKKHFSDWSDNE